MDNFGVYQIELHGKCYVGSTTRTFRARLTTHLRQLRNNAHYNRHLQNTFNKYGEESFKFLILEAVQNPESVIEREQYYINTLKPKYNINKIAGNILGRKLSEETKKKMKRAKRHISLKTKMKMSEAKLRVGQQWYFGGYSKYRKVRDKMLAAERAVLNGR